MYLFAASSCLIVNMIYKHQSLHVKCLLPGRLWKAQINFSTLIFWGDIISKKRNCFLQLGNFESWEKTLPVASSAFSGALSTGICCGKSSDISKWSVCGEFAANLNLHLPVQEMQQPCTVLGLHFSWSCSEVLFSSFFGLKLEGLFS